MNKITQTENESYIEEMIILGRAWDIPEKTISELIIKMFNQKKEESNG